MNIKFWYLFVRDIGSDIVDILIKKSETVAIGNQIKSCVEEFNDEIKKYLATIENLEGCIQGHTNINNKLKSMKDDYTLQLQELADALQKFGQYLTNVPEAYSILDESCSSKQINA